MYEDWEKQAREARARKFSMDYPDISYNKGIYRQGVFHPGIADFNLFDMMFDAIIQATLRFGNDREKVWYCIHNISEFGKLFSTEMTAILFSFHRKMQQLGAVRVTLEEYKGVD